MTKLFYNAGKKVGVTLNKGKWYYQSAFGSEEKALQAELMVGRELALNISRENKIVKNQELQNSIDEIGAVLSSKVANKKRKFKFYIVSAEDINAFAIPGGFIFITNKLCEQIKNNRNEIAFVLAHEMMHIVFKHPMERIMAEYSTNLLSNILIKTSALGTVAKQVLGSLIKNTYSQEKEFEADEYAVRLMHSAGFEVSGAKHLLGKLQTRSNQNSSFYNYFASHPPIEERVIKIQEVITIRKMCTS